MITRSTFVARLPADLDNIKLPNNGQRWYQDTTVTPLRLRVSRRGLTWVFYGRTNDGPRRITLGHHPRMSADEARSAAQRCSADTTPASAPLTFSQLRIGYFASAEFLQLAPRTQKSYKWVLQGRYYEGLAERKVREMTRLDLLAIKDRINADGLAFQNFLRPAQALFSWALDRGYIDASPAVRLKLPLNQADPHPYVDDDLGSLVAAVREEVEPYRTLYLITAYTGQRPVTWGEGKWTEVGFKTATMTVSRKRGRQSKLGQGWAIPLAEPALKLLEALHKAQGRRRTEWIFGRPLVSVETKIRNRIAKAAGLASKSNRGTLHRFRATFLTKLDDWDIPTETAQRLAGHASPFSGSRGHYIVPKPSPEMREVAERYADFVNYCELL